MEFKDKYKILSCHGSEFHNETAKGTSFRIDMCNGKICSKVQH